MPTEQPSGVNLGAVIVWLRENLPVDAILCNGAGNYAAWIHRFFRFRRFAQHIAPTSGSMGYGVPAAVAMKRFFPERPVVCIAGDGDFLMNGQEFATAVQYDLPITIIINDNGLYGTIRMHQEREYPGRISATDLRNPDFAAYARAFGGHGETVEQQLAVRQLRQRVVQRAVFELASRAQLTRRVAHADDVDTVAQSQRRHANGKRAAIEQRDLDLIGVRRALERDSQRELEIVGIDDVAPQRLDHGGKVVVQPAGGGRRQQGFEGVVPQRQLAVVLDDDHGIGQVVKHAAQQTRIAAQRVARWGRGKPRRSVRCLGCNRLGRPYRT